MKFLANENFPLKSYGFLLDNGFDIIHVGVEYPSIKDEEVMMKAWEGDRLIITFDSDYGDLVFVKGLSPLRKLRFSKSSRLVISEKYILCQPLGLSK